MTLYMVCKTWEAELLNICENHRNTSAIKFVLSLFRPVSHIRDFFCFFVFWLGHFLRMQGCQKPRDQHHFAFWWCPTFRPLSYFGNCWNQVISQNLAVTPWKFLSYSHTRNLIRCVPFISPCPALGTFSFDNVYRDLLYVHNKNGKFPVSLGTVAPMLPVATTI